MELDARRILIYRIGNIGDTVVALPALWAVRRHFPNAHIVLLCNDNGNFHLKAADVLPSQGLINEWLTYPGNDRGSSLLQLLAFLPRLRRLKLDTLVYLAPRLRAKKDVRRDLLYFRLAGLRNFIAHRGLPSALPHTAGKPLAVVDYEADHLLARLANSAIPVPDLGKGDTSLALTKEEKDQAIAWLKRGIPQLARQAPRVAFAPGSKWPSKVWPEDRFAELGQLLIRDANIYPVVFGGREDGELAERLIQRWGRGLNAAGQLRVRESAATLEHCSLYVGNDTGTMHLAASVGVRCVVVMSAQDWPGRWHPYGPGHTVLRVSVPCEGCMQATCKMKDLRCLTDIRVEEVERACLKALLPVHAGIEPQFWSTSLTH